MKNRESVSWIIVLLAFIIGIISYSSMPEQMASHWNINGEVDGYMSKSFGIFFMPIISVFLLGLFLLIPKIDPLKDNIRKFRKYYDEFIVVMLSFLFYVYLLTVVWNLGIRFNMSLMMFPMIGLLFYYCGILMENAKRNWFIGIRTPWTLSNESVWDKTHKRGAKLFKAMGILSILGIAVGKYAIFLILVPAISISVYLFIYSYFEYKKETEK